MEVGGAVEKGGVEEFFHIAHKIPPGNGPYARAKHLQLVEKDLDGSVPWFCKAIESGDRVDSALKDMAVVLKQRGRANEAVGAIKAWRHLCSKQAEESIDNLLIDLYKACGRMNEEILLLKQKLRKIYHGKTFMGKTTKKARSHGKKIIVSVKQETSRILGNLAWAYMQQSNYVVAEAVYRKAQMIDPDANKAINLALCLIEQSRFDDALQIVNDILDHKYSSFHPDGKIGKKAEELVQRIRNETQTMQSEVQQQQVEDELMELLDIVVKQWAPYKSKRLPIFEEISSFTKQMAC